MSTEVDLTTAVLYSGVSHVGSTLFFNSFGGSFVIPGLAYDAGAESLLTVEFDIVTSGSNVGGIVAHSLVTSEDPGSSEEFQVGGASIFAPGSFSPGDTSYTLEVGLAASDPQDVADAITAGETHLRFGAVAFGGSSLTITGMRYTLEAPLPPEWGPWIQPAGPTRIARFFLTEEFVGPVATQREGGAFNKDAVQLLPSLEMDALIEANVIGNLWRSKADEVRNTTSEDHPTVGEVRTAVLAGTSTSEVTVDSDSTFDMSPLYRASQVDEGGGFRHYDFINSVRLMVTPSFVVPNATDWVDLGDDGLSYEWHPDDLPPDGDDGGISGDYGEVLDAWVTLVWRSATTEGVHEPSLDTNGAFWKAQLPTGAEYSGLASDGTTWGEDSSGLPGGSAGLQVGTDFTMGHGGDGVVAAHMIADLSLAQRNDNTRVQGSVGGRFPLALALNAVTDAPGSWGDALSELAMTTYDFGPESIAMVLDMAYRPPRYRVLYPAGEVPELVTPVISGQVDAVRRRFS